MIKFPKYAKFTNNSGRVHWWFFLLNKEDNNVLWIPFYNYGLNSTPAHFSSEDIKHDLHWITIKCEERGYGKWELFYE